jgi:2-hydroxy-3-oxopropionate reductase
MERAVTRVAFIGLGVMGAPMARNLVSAGFSVIGYSRTTAKVDRLVAAGGKRAEGIAEAVAAADVVATMLPDSPDVEQVAYGPEGIFAHVRPGALMIDFSSIRPDSAARLAKQGASLGVGVLDAPVSGGEQGAIDATLSIMVGGAVEDFRRAQPVLDAVGETVTHIGPAGSGQTVKAANQLIVAGIIELVAEALVFLEAHGVDPRPAFDALAGGLAGNAIIDRKGMSLITRDYRPGFRMALHHKDMGIVAAAARQAGVVLPAGALVGELVAARMAQGDGDLDHTVLLKGVESLSGRHS